MAQRTKAVQDSTAALLAGMAASEAERSNAIPTVTLPIEEQNRRRAQLERSLQPRPAPTAPNGNGR